MKDLGAQGLAFRPIVAFGNHTSIPHHKPTDRKLKQNDIVLLDFGCKVDGFCSDFSRTFFIGQPKPEWQKVYRIVKISQQKVLGAHRVWSTQGTSVKAAQIDSIARDYIKKQGYGKQFVHGLGHGIGTRVHQYFKIGPKSKAIIKPGMVFTIEPGIYMKNRFGVRIEDVVYLSSSGLQILTLTKP